MLTLFFCGAFQPSGVSCLPSTADVPFGAQWISRQHWRQNVADNRFTSKASVDVEIAVDGSAVNYLEHVEAIVNVRHSRRGALEIHLTSPQGTRVQLLSGRPRDTSKAGFVNWPLMSVATWGENPRGIWILSVQDMTDEENTGTVGPIRLVLHGTAEMPAHMSGPKSGLDRSWSKDPTNYWVEAEKYEDPSVFTEVENELLRMNHRNNDLSLIGV